MNKLFKFLMLFTLSLSILVVSCKDDEEVPPVVVKPTIISVTPNQGTVGTAVTITGTNLEDVTRVTFGGVNAENFNPDDNTATTITASVPAGLEPGAQNIVVTSPGGTATIDFTVVEDDVTPGEPTIVSFNPVSGNVGDPVTITGTDLDLADSVFIGDVRIMDWEVADDAATATFTIPEGAQTGTFVIFHGDDATAVESASEFTVGDDATGDAPTITRFTPASGPVGTPVTITGTNLNMADTAFIGDVMITDWEVAEDGTSATFTIPEGAETGTFRLSVEGGEDVETMETFTVGEPFATITSFEPMTGAVGQSVTITGTNLNMADTARIGDVVITDWMAAEDGTSATFTVPAGATTDVITLVNAEGARVVSTDEFTVEEGFATISSFNPVIGGVGTAVTVTGTNLNMATSARIGDVDITDWIASEDGTTATFTIPEGGVTGDLTIANEAGDEVVGAEPFTVDETAQTIGSFNPTIGGVGISVTVTGTNLNNVTSARIGDVDITDFEASEDGTTAIFTVPEGGVTGPLTFGTDAGVEVTSTAMFIVDEAAPTVTSFDPLTGPVGTGVTVTGTNLNMVTTARMGDVDITDFEAAEDGTTATFTIPEGGVTGPFTFGTDAGGEVTSVDPFTVE